VLDLGVQSQSEDEIANIDVSATFNPQSGGYTVLLLNRHLDKSQEVTLDFREAAPRRPVAFETLTGPDLKAANTFTNPRAVLPSQLDLPKASASMKVRVPAKSYSILRLSA
jgi:alpha-N-arabinofuranosidase